MQFDVLRKKLFVQLRALRGELIFLLIFAHFVSFVVK